MAIRLDRGRAGFAVLSIEGTGAEPREGASDVHSHARPDRARVTHLALDARVDFEKQALEGVATLRFERPADAPADSPLVLDTRGLIIEKVTAPDPEGVKPRDVPYKLGDDDPVLGASLTIEAPVSAREVSVAYRTTARATALQWLSPKGTAGGKQPFLFTQSQAIQARSWIPLQDSPGIRITYEAKIDVPSDLTAVMSAEMLATIRNGERSVTAFRMDRPIPPYLIALAVGDLEFRAIGPRTGVYAEPSVVAAAASEFADTEKMVKTIERQFGAYRWGRYDILVLPPSFPYGGMENPRLTFATPTVIAGDRSLVSLIAHELAHSWSGNLVTNATWSDFWLNEGFTTYLERRVLEELYGADRAEMERVLGIQELRKELATVPRRDQILKIDLAGRDPDEALSRVPYEKGALFLTHVEHLVGRDRFDAFLRNYFNGNAFQSITTAQFVEELSKNLLQGDREISRALDLRAWLEEPGLPGSVPEAVSRKLELVKQAAHDWSERKTATDALKTADWSTHEWLHFLRSLPDQIDVDRLRELDDAFKLTDRGNSEIAQQWLVIAVRNNYGAANARLEAFLTTIGRRKFLTPLYTELLKTPEGAVRAKALYARARPFYHPITIESLDRLMPQPKAD